MADLVCHWIPIPLIYVDISFWDRYLVSYHLLIYAKSVGSTIKITLFPRPLLALVRSSECLRLESRSVSKDKHPTFRVKVVVLTNQFRSIELKKTQES